MNIRPLIFCLAVCGMINHAGGQHPVAAGVFDRNDIETGDTFVLRILVSGTEARPDRADFSPWSRWIPAENVLRSGQWTRSGAQWINNYTLIVFDSFHTTLPPLPVRLLSGDSAMTNPVQLAVRATSAPDNPADMDPIRGLQEETIKWTDWMLLGLVVAVVAGGVTLWRRRRMLPRQAPPAPANVTPPVRLSPEEVALKKLQALAHPKAIEAVKPFYAELSLIMNEYIEHRYHIPAMESTTRETERLLNGTDFPPLLWNKLKQLLQQSDRVKYAGDSAAHSDHGAMIQLAIDIIQANPSAG